MTRVMPHVRVSIAALPPLNAALATVLDACAPDIDRSGSLAGPDGPTVHLVWVAGTGMQKAFAEYCEQRHETASPIPLFLTDNIDDRHADGFSIPLEFIWNISTWVFGLPERIRQLATIYPTGVCVEVLRECAVGNFRHNLGMDHLLHDTGSDFVLDFVALKEWSATTKDFITSGIPGGWAIPKPGKTATWPDNFIRVAQEPLFRTLFPSTTKTVGECASKLQTLLKTNPPSPPGDLQKQREFMSDAIRDLEQALPRGVGHDISYFFAVKPCVLVVDDEAEVVAKRLTGRRLISEDSSQASLGDLIDFIPAFNPALSEGEYTKALVRILKMSREGNTLRQYDAVLLDLSFAGEGHTSTAGDPLGWRLLPILQRFLPDIPIIIHSSFGDATQVRRAYEKGASWFLKKDEADRLPSRLLQLLKTPLWDREWRSVVSSVEFDIPDINGPGPREKYLWWKTLESQPGGRIRIRPLGAGIGGAVTAKAWKEIGGSYNVLPPMIVKIDNPFDMGMEFERYRRFIEPYLSNRAGRIASSPFRAGLKHSAIAYTCAGSSQGVTTIVRRTEIVNLFDLLGDNVPRHTHSVLPAERYDAVLTHLLDDTLPRIHRRALDQHDIPDFPNAAFGEFANPLDGYLMRLPPAKTMELSQPLMSLIKPREGGEIECTKVMILEPNATQGTIKAFTWGEGGLIERVDLTGLLTSFYTDLRYLRRYEVLGVPGELKETDRGGWGALQPPEAIQAYLLDDVKCSSIPNLLAEATVFARQKSGPQLAKVPQGIIHGDLNLGNIMVERERGGEPVPMGDVPWLIDFAWSRRDAIVCDYAELEMDMLTRLGKRYLFGDDGKDHAVAQEFRNAYLETPWLPPGSVHKDARRLFLWSLMNKVRSAAELAGIDANAYAHARLLSLLVVAKILLGKLGKNVREKKEVDCFPAALCINWVLHQHKLLRT